MSSTISNLYTEYDGDWVKFYRDATAYWREQNAAKAPPFEQPPLLGCPWCGVIPVVEQLPSISPATFDIRCRNRNCPRRVISAKTPQEAADKWNTRVPTHAPLTTEE